MAKTGWIICVSKFSVCYSTKSKFIKEGEAKWLISKPTGIKVPSLCDLAILNTLF